jgi:tetratricopeptide (TPR) repeat protein
MEEAVRLSGHDPERIVQLGQMYRQQGDLTRSLAQAELAISANAQLASAWALQGDVQKTQGHRQAALASYHRALSYQPCYFEVQLSLAEIYLQEKRPQRSLATLQAVAANFPAGQIPTPVLISQGLALRDLGRAQDASRALAQAAQRGNPSPDLLFELASAHAAAGETAAARAALSAALERHPDHTASLALAKDLGNPPTAVIAANHTPQLSAQ